MTALTRRSTLAGLQPIPDSNAGLWLDRYLQDLDATDGKRNLVKEVCAIKASDDYRRFFGAWKIALSNAGATIREATVDTRMVVGLGAEALIETGITLHRTYGVPYVPGSALKGLAGRYAAKKLADPAWKMAAHEVMFGTTDAAGFVTFFDALYLPDSGHEKQALHPDIITVHHSDYYSGRDVPPADWDSPNPVSFITATGTYLVALKGPEEWVTAAFDILEKALTEEGIGGKTSRGYGRMKLKPVPRAAPTATPPVAGVPGPSSPLEFRSVKDVKSIPDKLVPNSIGDHVSKWRKLADGPEKRLLAQAVLERVDRHWKTGQTKLWYKEIRTSLTPPTVEEAP